MVDRNKGLSDAGMENDNRPDPDRLLQQIQAENRDSSRGKLIIFLGYSAGVGKTYKMLQTAHTRQNQGIDVVIGLVDTHGRVETDALLEGLAVIPRKQVEYRGITISDMDLDAIIERKPQLVLVDELAHSNPPHSSTRNDMKTFKKFSLLALTCSPRSTFNTLKVSRTSSCR